MRQLAIECASEACSIALFEGEELIAHHHEVLGRGHAERLIPLIEALPDKGKAKRILVSRGPGSFTGVRIGLAAARALGFTWEAKVLGYPTLALVSAVARARYPDKAISVAMRAGHGEVFVQNFDAEGMPQDEPASLTPDEAAKAAMHKTLAGTMAEEIAQIRGSGEALQLHPDARAIVSLPPKLLTDQLSAIYVRPPDAKLPKAKPAGAPS